MKGIMVASLLTLLAAPAVSYGEYPVAGTQPSMRPAGAPVIESFDRNDAWRTTAVSGISNPVPASLKFLDDQGAWYTPFNRPGMTGRYDIRRWHASDRFEHQ